MWYKLTDLLMVAKKGLMAKTIELKVGEGTSKEGRKYTYCAVLADDVEITRIFIKPTEYAFFADIVGSYKLDKSNL